MMGISVVVATQSNSDGEPLALVRVEGESLLAHHLHAAQLARLGGPICVLGDLADRVEAEHADWPGRFVHVRAREPMEAVRAGLRAVPAENAAFLTPVEVIPPRLDTFDLIAEAVEQLETGILGVRPRMRDTYGYPVVLLPGAVRDVAAAPTIADLERWMDEVTVAGRFATVDVDDYNVLSRVLRSPDPPAAHE